MSASSSIGLKILGGRFNPFTNELSAYVVKVKKNSVADRQGQVQVGDEVVEWNGHVLRGLTYDQVFQIMQQSKYDHQVELVIERPIE